MHNGDDDLLLAEVQSPDLVLPDTLLPGTYGYTVGRRLRERGCRELILMLTSLGSSPDRMMGLDCDDDYLIRLFAFPELLARVRELLRRDSLGRDPVLRLGDLEIDTISHQAQRSGKTVD